jgi:hypothetical protein
MLAKTCRQRVEPGRLGGPVGGIHEGHRLLAALGHGLDGRMVT